MLALQDELIKWEPYRRDEIVCGRFPLDVWHDIASDIDTDTEWGDFVFEYRDYVSCWILRKQSDESAIAMLYVYNEDNWKVVSIHGGVWGNNPILAYRGYIVMIDALLSYGVKVRTVCSKKNSSAHRFNSSIGFVAYKEDVDNCYMWINKRRLYSSKIFKRCFRIVK